MASISSAFANFLSSVVTGSTAKSGILYVDIGYFSVIDCNFESNLATVGAVLYAAGSNGDVPLFSRVNMTNNKGTSTVQFTSPIRWSCQVCCVCDYPACCTNCCNSTQDEFHFAVQ